MFRMPENSSEVSTLKAVPALGMVLCESCRQAPATQRVLFDDGAVFAVCPSCAAGALVAADATVLGGEAA
jgi:hypothetical protein